MAYLLDTDILSAMRRKQRDANLQRWLHHLHPTEIFLSVVTLGEIERGICQQQQVNAVFAADLRAWLDTLLISYHHHILPLSTGIALRWGQLSAQLGHNSADLMIAATALEHNLTVATRNTRHFEPAQVPLINPYLGG